MITRLGLTRHQSAVYLALLEQGGATIADIERVAGLHRPLVYKALPGLLERGLIEKIPRGKRILYAAAAPEKLQTLLDGLAGEFAAELPALVAKYDTKGKAPLTRWLPGRSGIVAVYDDIARTLKKGEAFYRYTSPVGARARDRYVSKEYVRKSKAKELLRYVITTEENAARRGPSLSHTVKVLPKRIAFAFDVTFLIYGGKVAYVDYATENAIIIEHAAIAEFQKKLFKMLFAILPDSRKSDK